MTDKGMTCSDCDELLAAYFENDLDAALRRRVDVHASECAKCHGLLRDVKEIVTEAGALPDLAPARDLWQGIEERIQPAVVSISGRREGAGFSRRALVAAAAAIVVVTSSVTYLATSRTLRPPNDTRRVAVEAGSPIAPEATIAGSPAVSNDAGDTGMREDTEAAGPVNGASVKPPLRVPVSGGSEASGRARLAAAKAAPMSASERVLSTEIAALQQLLDEKRAQLDPATVSVVEENLALIDVAVKQARGALARDPASGFLTGKLDNALHKKVELLRTAALLPSRS